MKLQGDLELESLKACEVCIESQAEVADMKKQLDKRMVEIDEVKKQALLDVSAVKKDKNLLMMALASKLESQVTKEARLIMLEQRQNASLRLLSYLMAGSEFVMSQLFRWHCDIFPGWKGLDLEDVSRNTVIQINETHRIAKECGKTLLWCKMGPVDLNDPKLGVSKEMYDYYHLTVSMKEEYGVCPGYKHDRLLMKNPLNCEELNLNVNTNSDLFQYMSDNFPMPAVLNLFSSDYML